MRELFTEKGNFESKVAPGKEVEGINIKTILNGRSRLNRRHHTAYWPCAAAKRKRSFTWILNLTEEDAIALLER
jgi:uncharacterized protein